MEREKDYNTINGNRIIILADDGAATDASIIAAARWIKKNNKSKKPFDNAIPVASKQTKELLKREAGNIEVITSPSTSNYKSVGQYFQSFEPLTNEKLFRL